MFRVVEQLHLARAKALALRWSALAPTSALVVALTLIAAVAVLDYMTGYEQRFGILYLAPVALATWTGGWQRGIAIVAVSVSCWFVSFRSAHVYAADVLFYWDGVVMAATFMTFVLLLDRLRAALASADERFLRVLEELQAAVYVVDRLAGDILYANRRLADIVEADPRALRVSDLEERFWREGEASAGEDSPKRHAENVEVGFRSREVFDQASGRWYLVQAGPIPWKGGRRVDLRLINDISEQRHAQMLKRQHQDMLHQQARLAALAEIASSLAHEMNQPLMAIASYNDACLRFLAEETYDRNEIISALEKSRGQALRAGKIISRMRDFIRSRHPHPTRCDLNAVIKESLELLETQLVENGVTTQLVLDGALPKTNADRILLIQVVVNLAQNAIDAMRSIPLYRRKLRISTGCDPEDAILVSVSDQGEGVSEEIKDRLYAPFSTTKPQGLGLGLSICRSVVEAHGGRLWHHANPWGGTTFHFTILPDVE